ncbi:MAG: HAD family phosphatase [Desulfomonile sp.]|nr:HAD family phosphatase [Desulfomonile sp.]
MSRAGKSLILAVLFDFGGVLAEEGFREGLMAIGRANGLDPAEFFAAAAREAYNHGYVVGRTSEHVFWGALRRTTGIKGSDEELRNEILDRFIVRPWMLDIVRNIRKQARTVCILSDQTNWLEELDLRHGFFKEFDRVFNSFRLGISKADPTIFPYVAAELGLEPSQILFIDDNAGHIGRARSQGLHGVLFVDKADLLERLDEFGLKP